MDIKNILLFPIIIGAVIFGIVGLMSDMTTFYGTDIDGNYSEVYGSINESVAESIAVGEDFRSTISTSERAGVIGDILFVSSAIWKAIKLPFQTIGSINNIFGSIFGALPFPAWVTSIFVAVVVIVVASLVLGAMIRWKV